MLIITALLCLLYHTLQHVYVCSVGHLQFCIRDSEEACPSFKCTILPGTKPTPSEWMLFCSPESEISSEHVTYHKLTDVDKSLSTILARYSKSNIHGLIIINVNGSVLLSHDFAVKEGEILMQPVFVVSLEDGEELEKFIGARGKESVLIKIDRNEPVDRAEPLQHPPSL